jgi:phosphogluconate dehydratase
MTVRPEVAAVTDRIIARSAKTRARYLEHIRKAADNGPRRRHLGCANLAHGFAACGPGDKEELKHGDAPNIGIVTAYNDMLSAHQPLEDYPRRLKEAARRAGGVAQVAGGVPAMCDGVTQGRAGMELSLLSRDVIALSTAVALSHDMFDAALYLGVCDKIVPGLLIGALSFGHLPGLFVPAGPMTSGLPNPEKAKIRQLYAEGKVGRAELLEAEAQSYHGPGTCTFYGTANSNQMLMEIMGLMLPGAAFVNPGTPLRDTLTSAAATRALELTKAGSGYIPLGEIVDERCVVNAIAGLHATGGSTNHTIHLIAMARAAGVLIDWEDFADLSKVVPLLCRIYPNGVADVNHFQAAGGMPFLIREMIEAGLLHENVNTVAGHGLRAYTREPLLQDGELIWRDGPKESLAPKILRPAADPFDATGGLVLLKGNIGRAVIKTSAMPKDRSVIEAPAMIFNEQADVEKAFKQGVLDRDFIAVVRFQGPRANGMPELHKLTPILGILQDRGRRVALVTDGRMSGASGKVPAAIHVTPEALEGGAIGKIQDGDMLRLNCETGELSVLVDASVFAGRVQAQAPTSWQEAQYGMSREIFAPLRAGSSGAEAGGSFLGTLS